MLVRAALSVRFGDFVFDSLSRELRRADRAVALSPKAFQLLQTLLERRPQALSKSDLLQTMWPETFVSESSLARLASELRTALDDDARNPRFLRTVYGFGYSFCGEVKEVSTPTARPGRVGWRLRWGTREIPLQEGEQVLGRAEDAEVWIDSAKISRRHARITITKRGATIEDLGSKNGTFVRGTRVQGAAPLAEGDEICLGPVLLTFLGPIGASTTEAAGSS